MPLLLVLLTTALTTKANLNELSYFISNYNCNMLPDLQGIKTRVVEMPCLKAGKQQKIVIDAIVSIDAPDFEFGLAVKVLLTLLINRN